MSAGTRAAACPSFAAELRSEGNEGFRLEVGALGSLHADLWASVGDEPPRLGEPVTRRRQKEGSAQAERLLEEVACRCEGYPESEPARRAWRANVRERVRRFGEDRLGWPDGYRSLVLSEAFYETTVEFVREARAFDPHVRLEDVTQALRNVWIMNSLQLLFDRAVTFSTAVFAYSMLYPYTDNYLDDPKVPVDAKVDFNDRLGRRLRGESLLPRTSHEQRVFELVARVERQYSRFRYPDVFRSLLAIHEAQEASLVLQRRDGSFDPEDVLELSVAKGGASLLADGYLVVGDLTPEEAELCFGYGVFLQLLDDLQDVQADRAAGHATAFTIAAHEGTLDRLTGRLYHYMHRVLGRSARLASPAHDDQKDLILRNCTFLMVRSIARHRRLFSRSFLRALEERWPFDLSAMLRLPRLAERRFRRVARGLCRRGGVGSLLDLL